MFPLCVFTVLQSREFMLRNLHRGLEIENRRSGHLQGVKAVTANKTRNTETQESQEN